MKWNLFFGLLFLCSSVGFVNVAKADRFNTSYAETQDMANAEEAAYAEMDTNYAKDAANAAGAGTGLSTGAIKAIGVIGNVAAGAAAQQSDKAAKAIGLISLGVGTYLVKTNTVGCAASPSKPGSCMMMAMGWTTILQGGVSLITALANKKKTKKVCPTCVQTGSGGDGGLTALSEKNVDWSQFGLDTAETKKLIKQARKKTNNGRTVNTPAGKLPMEKANMGALASAFGLNKSQLAMVKKDIAKANAKERAKVEKYYGGKKIGVAGGSSSSKSRRRVVYEDDDSFADNKNYLDKKRYVASVAGLSKKFGDSMIGVKGDNIFLIVKRTYKAKKAILLKE
ncbi:MAG: hypothetical protein HAW63_00010 [Bdellovibrionaceae bacterium]|nr:hypothetical protein [Pseudobdellovibrionaceae bacterium]